MLQLGVGRRIRCISCLQKLSYAELQKEINEKKGQKEALPHNLSRSAQVRPQVAFFR